MNPTCPTNCDAALGEVLFDDCAPAINASEIKRLFIARANATPFTTWATAAEWTTRLSQDGVEPNAIRALTVIGDMPAGAPVQKDISNGRKFTLGKDRTVNFTVDEDSDENYEFFRALECGGKYRIWFETHGGYMFGGNEGIKATVNADPILNRGTGEIVTYNGAATWRSKFAPERVKSPIFVEA